MPQEQGLIVDSAFGHEAFEAAIMDLLDTPTVSRQSTFRLTRIHQRATDYFLCPVGPMTTLRPAIAKNIAFSAASDYGATCRLPSTFPSLRKVPRILPQLN